MAKFKPVLLLSLLTALSGRPALAKIIVNLPDPAPQNDINTNGPYELYQAGGAAPTPVSGYLDTKRGFRYIKTSGTATDVRQPENLVFVDIFTDKKYTVPAGGHLIVMLSTTAATTNAIPIIGAGGRPAGVPAVAPVACSGGSNCQSTYSDGLFYAAEIKTGQWLRLSFSLYDLCANPGATGNLCGGGGGSAYAGISGAILEQSIQVNIGVVPNNSRDHARLDLTSGQTTQPNQQLETQTFTLNVSDLPPAVNCSGIAAEEQFYFPGDRQIFLKIGNFTSSDQGGPPLKDYLFLGKIGSQPLVPPSGFDVPTGSDVVSYTTGYSGTERTVTGFTNTTNGVDNAYVPVVHLVNVAGLISDIGTSCVPNVSAINGGVRTQTISGVLQESKCFIATAAYQDGRAAPVMMLRKFRDRILARSEWGRKFIETYYVHSPAWAEWAWDKPLIRSLALKLLTPLELAAWVMLKVAGAEQVSPATTTTTSPEPYLDRLRQTIPPAKGSPENYTVDQKKILEQSDAENPAASSEDYARKQAEKLKQEEGEKSPESSEQYSEKARAALPPEQYRANPSELVKQGRDRKMGYGEVPPIKNAVSIRFGVSPGMQVSVNGAPAENSFTSIYGEGWKPEFLIHFERQLFHSENFGSFGLTADTGISYVEGFGLLQFAFAGSRESQTKLSFIQVPLLLGGNYRFNFLRVLRPYVGAGIGAMLFTEIRNDDRGDKRGYSFIYDAHVGLSFLMDFLDPDTARDSYLSQGVQHTYLFAEYFYLNTLGSSVIFSRSGIYSGFLFEL